MTEWLDGLTAWLSAHPQWLGLALFVVACTECLAIIGLLMPGAVLLFTLAVLAGSTVRVGSAVFRDTPRGTSTRAPRSPAACAPAPCCANGASGAA